MAVFFPDFASNLEWEPILLQDYLATVVNGKIVTPIPPVTIALGNTRLAIVAIGSEDVKPNWYTGGWVTFYFPFQPHYTVPFPRSIVQYPQSLRLRVNNLNLVPFPDYRTPTNLVITPVRYLKSATVQVLQFVGTERDTNTDLLNQILSELA
jgi:hypothetical protein